MEPTLRVFFYSALAALCAGMGAFLATLRASLRPRRAWLGWANAVAAGLMLGVAYGLMAAGLGRTPALGALGAVIGIAFPYWTHGLVGAHELDLNRLTASAPGYGRTLVLVNTLHAAPEGVAIAVAMALDPLLGGFTAVAIAVHNVPEAAVLAAVLRAQGFPPLHASVLAAATRSSQVVLAVAMFALVAAAPGLLPWALGFAVGSLLYLVMAELLPHCYREAGHTSVALVTVLAMGMVVLMVSAP